MKFTSIFKFNKFFDCFQSDQIFEWKKHCFGTEGQTLQTLVLFHENLRALILASVTLRFELKFESKQTRHGTL